MGSVPNNDSGVDMPGTGPGSLGDLTALDDMPPGADASALAAPSAGGLQLRQHLTAMHRLEQLKKEKLKSLKDSCSWAGQAPHTRNTKLPPLPGSGEWRPWCVVVWGGGEPGAAPGRLTPIKHDVSSHWLPQIDGILPAHCKIKKLRLREVKVLHSDQWQS